MNSGAIKDDEGRKSEWMFLPDQEHSITQQLWSQNMRTGDKICSLLETRTLKQIEEDIYRMEKALMVWIDDQTHHHVTAKNKSGRQCRTA